MRRGKYGEWSRREFVGGMALAGLGAYMGFRPEISHAERDLKGKTLWAGNLEYGGQIIICQKTLASAEDMITSEPLEKMKLKGINNPVASHSVLGVRGK